MATAKPTNQLKNQLECPKCFSKMTTPLELECHHFFCQTCIDDIILTTPQEDNSSTGCRCPLCEKLTKKDDLKPMDFVRELLDIVEKAQSTNSKCVGCKETIAIERCVECKGAYCQTCKDNHEIFPFLQGHTWEQLDDGKTAKVDELAFCKIHPTKHVEVHCYDCKRLICVLCSAGDHKGHGIETVNDAVQRITKDLRENQDILRKTIKDDGIVHERVISDAEDIKKKYEEMETNIDRKYDELMLKLNEEKKQAKKDLSDRRTEQTSGIGETVKLLERKIKTQKNILAISEATLESTDGSTLFKFLEKGIKDSFGACTSNDISPKMYSNEPDYIFRATKSVQGNMLGNILERPNCSNWIPCRMDELARTDFTLLREIAKEFICVSCIVVKNELWCLSDDGEADIYVFSLENEDQRTIKLESIGTCRNLTYSTLGVFLATSTGLFLIDCDGKNSRLVIEGNFCDVSIRTDSIYVLERQTPKIHILTLDATGKIKAHQHFQLEVDYSDHDFNTIQVTNSSIYIGNLEKDNIIQCNLQGKEVAIYTYREDNELDTPSLCGTDGNGVLIANWGNQRLLTLSDDNEWQQLNIEGLKNPTCAVFYCDKIIVMPDEGEDSIQIFSMN